MHPLSPFYPLQWIELSEYISIGVQTLRTKKEGPERQESPEKNEREKLLAVSDIFSADSIMYELIYGKDLLADSDD